MIRDPSDGSIKEPKVKSELTNTGLAKPEVETSDERERLERAREWLRNYLNKS